LESSGCCGIVLFDGSGCFFIDVTGWMVEVVPATAAAAAAADTIAGDDDDDDDGVDTTLSGRGGRRREDVFRCQKNTFLFTPPAAPSPLGGLLR
jgi:hypothetical protein